MPSVPRRSGVVRSHIVSALACCVAAGACTTTDTRVLDSRDAVFALRESLADEPATIHWSGGDAGPVRAELSIERNELTWTDSIGGAVTRPLDTISRVEIVVGTQSKAFAIGGAIAGVLYIAIDQGRCKTDCARVDNEIVAFGEWALAGAIGAGVGALIGSSLRRVVAFVSPR